MKKSVLLLAVIFISALSANAAEPLLLQPLGTVLSTSPATNPQLYVDASNQELPQVTSATANGVYEATYVPADSNMVPQNAAAKGEPIPQKAEPWINIRTKQRSQGNDYWNPGGKGTKSYF